MPKKSTGYTPKKSKSNPVAKQEQPLKAPSLSKGSLPEQIKAPNAVASMPKVPQANSMPKVGNIGKPAKIIPRTPRI